MAFNRHTVHYDKNNLKGAPPSKTFTYLIHPSNKTCGKIGTDGSITSNNSFASSDNFDTPTSQHSNFLYIYFRFAYYLLLAPFRFEKDGDEKFVVCLWLPQQILCGLSNLLSVLRLLTSVRTEMSKIRSRDPASFFMLFWQCSSFVFKTTSFALFWRKSYAFEKLINFLCSSRHLVPYNPYKIQSKKIITGFCGTYAVVCFLRMGFGSSFIKYKDWSPEWIYRRLVADARYTFFLLNSTSVNSAPELSEISATDIFLTIIHGLSVQSRFITGFFVDLCILMHVMSLWAPCSGFSKIISVQQGHASLDESENEESISHCIEENSVSTSVDLDLILKQFEALKTLSVLVGEAFGAAIMPFIAESLFCYAIYFDSVILTPDVVTRFVLIFFYITAGCILIFSAEVARKICLFKTFLGENDRLALMDQNQLAVIFDDLSNHSVGISASGIFTITYSFVGTVISILITYFIIQLQTASLVK